MTVNFYTVNDVENKINKTLNNLLSVDNVFFKEKNISLSNPFLKLNNFDYKSYNYCYIVELGKYYFFDSVTIENNNIIRIDLKIDTLMTYKNLIQSTILNIVECEQNYINSDCATIEKNDKLILSKIDIDVSNYFDKDTLVLVVQK